MKEAKEIYLPCNKSEATNYLDDEGDLLPVKKVKAIILEENEEVSQLLITAMEYPYKNGYRFSSKVSGYPWENKKGYVTTKDLVEEFIKENDLLASQEQSQAPVATLGSSVGNSVEHPLTECMIGRDAECNHNALLVMKMQRMGNTAPYL